MNNTNTNTKELIHSLFNNDTMKFEQTFNQVMASKISNVLNNKRNDMAKSVFNNQSNEL